MCKVTFDTFLPVQINHVATRERGYNYNQTSVVLKFAAAAASVSPVVRVELE